MYSCIHCIVAAFSLHAFFTCYLLGHFIKAFLAEFRILHAELYYLYKRNLYKNIYTAKLLALSSFTLHTFI